MNPPSKTIDIPGIGPVLFERSRRARRVSISIRPFTGVRVAVPFGVSFTKAEALTRERKSWIQKHLLQMRQYETDIANASSQVIDIDKDEAKRKLTSRLAYLAEKHGFACNRVSVRNQKTRWGSCSFHNNISLNMQLVRLPDDLIDYVLLHELAHTKIKNHSKQFWALLDSLTGNAHALRVRLGTYRIGVTKSE
ncbi:MAG: M48 family metallopeptidase [Dehalococcoidales bacterium]|jgi:predicted metal-dependent hydrolase|nr:M48 family metallopeptidase [Dehalococcoidales bacterium]